MNNWNNHDFLIFALIIGHFMHLSYTFNLSQRITWRRQVEDTITVEWVEHISQWTNKVESRMAWLEKSNVHRIENETMLARELTKVDQKIETLIATDELVMAMWPDEGGK